MGTNQKEKLYTYYMDGDGGLAHGGPVPRKPPFGSTTVEQSQRCALNIRFLTPAKRIGLSIRLSTMKVVFGHIFFARPSSIMGWHTVTDYQCSICHDPCIDGGCLTCHCNLCSSCGFSVKVEQLSRSRLHDLLEDNNEDVTDVEDVLLFSFSACIGFT
jgi:hypothetical protein